ncbi:MAG: hypothetical protein FWC68_00110 [Oscillospiraceae bacterium]|nr:hypothetical protein [Oscillospiraceae bacterium]
MYAIALMVLLVGGYYIILYYLNHRTKTDLLAKNKIIDRPNKFFEQEHIFITKIKTLSKIGEVIDKNVLNEYKISFEPNYEHHAIVFKNHAISGTFGAGIILVGNEKKLFKYKFQIEAWNTVRGALGRPDLYGANILLTAVERAFLKLDPDTEVIRKKAIYMKKPRLF